MRRAPVFRPLESCGALEIDKNIALDLPESSVLVFVCWSNAMVEWKYSGESWNSFVCLFEYIKIFLRSAFLTFLHVM